MPMLSAQQISPDFARGIIEFTIIALLSSCPCHFKIPLVFVGVLTSGSCHLIGDFTHTHKPREVLVEGEHSVFLSGRDSGRHLKNLSFAYHGADSVRCRENLKRRTAPFSVRGGNKGL